MTRRFASLGLLALIADVVMLNAVLIWLSRLPSGSAPSVLAIGNLLLGIFALVPLATLNNFKRPALPIIFSWGFAYCITYGAFVLWPNALPVALLRTAQTISPMAAVFITKDWRHEKSSRFEVGLALLAVALLGASAYVQTNRGTNHLSLLLFIMVALCYVISQSAARLGAKKTPALWTSIHLSLFNGVCLTAFLGYRGQLHLQGLVVLHASELSLMIALVQVCLLFGLKFSPPLLSGLILALGVPVAVLMQALQDGKAPPFSQMLLVSLFVVSLVAIALIRSKLHKLSRPLHCDT